MMHEDCFVIALVVFSALSSLEERPIRRVRESNMYLFKEDRFPDITDGRAP